MRLAWVMGNLTLSQRDAQLRAGSYLICEAVDAAGLDDLSHFKPRKSPMPESLIVYDRYGAGVGSLIAFTEGGEAASPFYPDDVPCDAYCAAIIDRVTV
ncbi:MAG: carbon dioxide concentrating mechanism protein CcmL [Planctomycetes bacterium]|nr:carbon dioxide concentrating mechanism protein CcmL [Planctomycetota bacterium]